MNKIITKDEQDFANQADQWCRNKIQEHQAKRVFLPSGSTPISLYAKWEKEKPNYLKGLELTQLDEVISGPKAGSFQQFFADFLPSFHGQFTELEKQNEIPDLVILGIGVNGHVGFHEPHVKDDFYKGYVELAPVTCQRMGVEAGTEGYSFGVDCFKRAKAILLMLKGDEKRPIAEQFFNNPAAKFPAALLRSHPDLTVILSKDLQSN